MNQLEKVVISGDICIRLIYEKLLRAKAKIVIFYENPNINPLVILRKNKGVEKKLTVPTIEFQNWNEAFVDMMPDDTCAVDILRVCKTFVKIYPNSKVYVAVDMAPRFVGYIWQELEGFTIFPLSEKK